MINVDLDGQIFDADQVIDALSKQVTPERLDRINSVISKRNNQLIPVMENIYDRGNTSAVMRSAEAFGFYNFHQIVEIDTFKESKRVTQGADKWLLQTHFETSQQAIDYYKSNDIKLYVTHLEGGIPIGEADFSGPTALVFGSERDGASPLISEAADQRVYIPMQGMVQSFNISVAAALCFQQVHLIHQKLGSTPLSDEERQELRALYLYRSLKKPNLNGLFPIEE